MITLTIIGVVAALTMPALIQKHQKLTTVTKLKETYSLLQQAIKLSEVDNDTVSNWDFGEVGCNGATEFTEQYIAPYLKVTKKCICDDTNECKVTATSMNDSTSTSDTDYYTSYGRSEKLFLSNGNIISISRAPGTNFPIFVIDINGKTKPNALGKDVFEFDFYNNGKLSPRGAGHNKEKLKTEPNGCHKNGTGAFCASLIILDNWQITDDYPW